MKSCPSHMNSAAIGGFAVMEVTIMLSGGCATQTSLPGSKPKYVFFVIPIISYNIIISVGRSEPCCSFGNPCVKHMTLNSCINVVYIYNIYYYIYNINIRIII